MGRAALSVVAPACLKFSSFALCTTTAPLYPASNHSFLLLSLLFGADVFAALDDAMSLISRLTIILLLSLSFLHSPTARAQFGVPQFLYPPTMPLAVRSPYLNCWLQANMTAVSFVHTLPTTSNYSQVLPIPYILLAMKYSTSAVRP